MFALSGSWICASLLLLEELWYTPFDLNLNPLLHANGDNCSRFNAVWLAMSKLALLKKEVYDTLLNWISSCITQKINKINTSTQQTSLNAHMLCQAKHWSMANNCGDSNTHDEVECTH